MLLYCTTSMKCKIQWSGHRSINQSFINLRNDSLRHPDLAYLSDTSPLHEKWACGFTIAPVDINTLNSRIPLEHSIKRRIYKMIGGNYCRSDSLSSGSPLWVWLIKAKDRTCESSPAPKIQFFLSSPARAARASPSPLPSPSSLLPNYPSQIMMSGLLICGRA